MEPAVSRIPPYGRELVTARSSGQRTNLFVYVGSGAWRYAIQRAPGNRLAIPDSIPWRDLDLSCVAGLGVTVIARGWSSDELDEFATRLVRSGADLVAGLHVTETERTLHVASTFYRHARRAQRTA